MSLFISEWLEGPQEFIYYAEAAYDPKITCAFDKNVPGQVITSASIFDTDVMHDLLEDLEDSTILSFVTRYKAVNSFVFKYLKMDDFLNKCFAYYYAKMGKSLEETEGHLTREFNALLMEFEFWYKIDIVDLYMSLIFYGMMMDPKPFIFILPPLSEWD